LPEENKYEVSGRTLEEYERMIDQGLINEAENQILESIDYRQKEDVLAAALFYQYLSEKDEEFLIKHNYSKKEVLDGIQNVMEHAGYGSIMDILLKD
jgi:Flp pilus assembly protein TadD